METTKALVVSPGISILGIDAGGTTGFALWDAWDQKLYVDHIDAGRGRRVRHRVMAGIVESPHRRDVEKLLSLQSGGEVSGNRVKAGRGLGKGRKGDLETICLVEHGVVTLLVDIVMAMGPKSIVVLEDFVLGSTGGGTSGARAGLSSPRITHRFWDRAWERGLTSGDAWREYTGHGWGGADSRGWTVHGEVPSFPDRLTAVERWRLEGRTEDEGVVWGGVGAKVVWQMPSERSFLSNVKAMDQWLRDRGMWIASRRHGMDALQHVVVMARKLGAEIQAEPERLWESGAKTDGKRISAKSAIRT
jgi:hypothetical protein